MSNCTHSAKRYQIIKQDISVENGVRARKIFGMVCISIEILLYLENLMYITADIHGMRHLGLIVAPQPIK
jgi:hypothetical protein